MLRGSTELRLVGNVKALREGERLTTVPLLVNS
jgi:hypothetical protein